ncbi:MAG: hypothetical protein AAFV33_00125 [Chloroflexota bacterium]
MREPHTAFGRFLYEYSMELFIVILLVGLGLLMFADRAGYTTNVYTEVLSVAITILILDRRAQRREDERRADEKT